MKLSRTSRCAKTRPRVRSANGFTLVEVLVSITILVVIVLLFGQMLAIMSKAWIYGRERTNNFTKARAMLELIAQDVQSGVFRPDLTAFPTSGSSASLEFYTMRPGIPASGTQANQLRTVSVVQYIFAPNALQRGDSSILWAGEGSSPAFNSSSFPATPTARDTAPGVVAFQFLFIQADGTFSTTYTPLVSGGVLSPNPTRAISIALAVIDDSTLKQLTAAQLTAINTSLTTPPVLPVAPLHSVKAYWDTYLNGTTMPWASYPKGLGFGLATFERYVSLPNAP